MDARQKDGTTLRQHLSSFARRDNEAGRIARQELAGPEFPEALAYLYDWSLELYGKSGVSMDGFLPLSYTTVYHWAKLLDRDVTPREVEMLMHLDSIHRHPPEKEKDG